MERRGSRDSEKKVRIKLKTDGGVKQDPKSVKAEGKSALKKQVGVNDISPDTSATSQFAAPPRHSDDLRKTEQSTNEAKKKESKDENEMVEKIRENVIDESPQNLETTSNLNMVDEEKPTESSTHIIENTTSTKLKVEEDVIKGSESFILSLKSDSNAVTTKSEERFVAKTAKLGPGRLRDKEKGKSSLLPEMLTSKNSEPNMNPDESAMQKEHVDSESISMQEDKITKESSLKSNAEGSKQFTKMSKDGSLSKPLSSIKEEDLGRNIKTQENSLNGRKAAGNSKEMFNDGLSKGSATTDKSEVIASNVVLIDDDDIRDAPSTKITIKVRRNTEDQDLGPIAEQKEGGNYESAEGKVRLGNNVVDVTKINIIGSNSAHTVQREEPTTENVQESTTAEERTNGRDDKRTYSQKVTIVRSEESTDRFSNSTVRKMPKQGMGSHSTDGNTRDITVKQRQEESSKEATKDFRKNNPDEFKDKKFEDETVLPDSASEGSKIEELKKRVRPGQVFIVKKDPSCYTVRGAEKRKVLAYKVGSKNTSRFSTVLVDTVEQLERASARHPSILSEFTQPANAKLSLLSTYFAGETARRSIKDNLIRETGTNTDRQKFQAKSNSTDYNLRSKDLSPDDFGGATPTTPAPTVATKPANTPDNYNYPFLTDYDVNHERMDHK